MLSFACGKPLAIVDGGKFNSEILHVQDPDKKYAGQKRSDKTLPTENLIEEILEDMYKKCRPRERAKSIELMKLHLKKDVEPIDDDRNAQFKLLKKLMQDMSKKELKVYDGNMIPIPNPETRDVLYVCGPSGSGKSTIIAEYGKQFKKLFPQKDIFLFSRLDEDPSIDVLKPKRIPINQDIITEPINPKELAESLVIFDDTDTITDKNLLKAVNNLKDDILETGRHSNIWVVVVSHLINNYKESRKVLNESHSVIVFPHSGGAHALTYFFKTYAGLNSVDIKKVMNLKSRWVQLHKHYPQSIVHQHGAYVLHDIQLEPEPELIPECDKKPRERKKIVVINKKKKYEKEDNSSDSSSDSSSDESSDSESDNDSD